MQPIVMPHCPWCRAQYKRQPGDRLEQATPTKRILIRCWRCKEGFYAGQQIRYVSSRTPA